MNGQSTITTKMVRWRAKDWASCFHACGFPLVSSRRLRFNQRVDKSCEKEDSSNKRKNQEKEEIGEINTAENETAESSLSGWPSFADGDYIVFCFKDDGRIDLEECESTASDRTDRGSRRRIDQQVTICENSENMVDEDYSIISDNEGEEKASEGLNIDFYYPDDDDDDIKEITEIEETTKWNARSRGSTSSNSSSGSFAFPVLDLEWKGSPERMPELEEQQNARRPIQCHCCRFRSHNNNVSL